MRKLGVLMVLIFLAPCVMAQTSSGTIGGTVPFVYSWTTTWNATIGTALANVNASHYNQGYIDIANVILTSTVQTNDSCQIAARMGSWTVPTGYPASGDKVDLSPDSDLRFMITGIDGADDLDVVGGFGSLTYLTTSDQACLRAKDGNGVSSSTFGADARVDMVWGVDLAGAYSVQITLTISQL
jgi:hypothetical protein